MSESFRQLEEHLDVRIGIIQSPRELTFETNDSAEEVLAALETARKTEGALATFTDTKGAQLLVNPAAIAYLEIGAKSGGRVGFVN